MTLNLKHPEGREVFFRLVSKADVVVENFRPGVMERLGLGFEKLKEVNPSLVYCAISGFGQNGPLKDSPAYDQIIQGLSGVMSVTGNDESGPLRVGFPMRIRLEGSPLRWESRHRFQNLNGKRFSSMFQCWSRRWLPWDG